MINSENKGDLKNFSHLLLDQVDERDVNIDILISILQKILHFHPSIRVILLSSRLDPRLSPSLQEYPCIFLPVLKKSNLSSEILFKEDIISKYEIKEGFSFIFLFFFFFSFFISLQFSRKIK